MKSRLIILTVLMAAFVSQSCEKFLEEELVSDVSASSYYTTASGFQDAVNATYSYTKFLYGPERGFTLATFGTDTYRNGADGGRKALNRYDGGLNPGQSYFRDYWNRSYQGINQANAVINRSKDLPIDGALKNARIAEVRFLRGLYYYVLVRTFGDVHLSLEETQGVEIEANRTSQSEIYSQAIIPDLEFAISNLPDEQDDYGRATKPAAEFLLAEALLTRSYKSFADGGDAARAESLFSNVINNYGFKLLDNYADLWDINNQKNEEIVFNIINSKAQVDQGIDGEGHRGHLYFLMEYDVRPGMTRDVTNGRPWKRFRPTNFLLDLWDRNNDARYDYTFKHAWISNNAGNIPIWTSEEASAGHVDASLVGQPKFAVGDTAIFIPGPGADAKWSADRQAKARYMVITRDEYTLKLFPSMNKWIDATRPDRQKTQGQRDYVLMRLGNAHLLRAEARLKQGNAAAAADDINLIRRRGAWPGKEDAVAITGAEVNLDFILDERARELVGEGVRWYDLVRTGKLVERVRLHNEDGAPNVQDFHNVRPIPQTQIDRTQGGYEQNCGYPGAGC